MTPDYVPLDSVTTMSSCTICGSVVHFNSLVTHTRWHEIMEPAWPLQRDDDDDAD